jgi:hypothetical protein
MYELMGANEVKRLAEILLTGKLQSNISISEPKLELELHIDSVSEPQENFKYENVLEEIFFMQGFDSCVLDIKGRKYELSYKIGEWGYEVNVPDSHISVGCKKFGDFFSQIELSYCLMDEGNIYIVKNISKLAGRGAISRLNGSAKTKEERVERRTELVKKLNMETLIYKGDQWGIICKLSKESLLDECKDNNTMYDFWNGFLRYTFAIETLRN